MNPIVKKILASLLGLSLIISPISNMNSYAADPSATASVPASAMVLAATPGVSLEDLIGLLQGKLQKPGDQGKLLSVGQFIKMNKEAIGANISKQPFSNPYSFDNTALESMFLKGVEAQDVVIGIMGGLFPLDAKRAQLKQLSKDIYAFSSESYKTAVTESRATTNNIAKEAFKAAISRAMDQQYLNVKVTVIDKKKAWDLAKNVNVQYAFDIDASFEEVFREELMKQMKPGAPESARIVETTIAGYQAISKGILEAIMANAETSRNLYLLAEVDSTKLGNIDKTDVGPTGTGVGTDAEAGKGTETGTGTNTGNGEVSTEPRDKDEAPNAGGIEIPNNETPLSGNVKPAAPATTIDEEGVAKSGNIVVPELTAAEIIAKLKALGILKPTDNALTLKAQIKGADFTTTMSKLFGFKIKNTKNPIETLASEGLLKNVPGLVNGQLKDGVITRDQLSVIVYNMYNKYSVSKTNDKNIRFNSALKTQKQVSDALTVTLKKLYGKKETETIQGYANVTGIDFVITFYNFFLK